MLLFPATMWMDNHERSLGCHGQVRYYASETQVTNIEIACGPHSLESHRTLEEDLISSVPLISSDTGMDNS